MVFECPICYQKRRKIVTLQCQHQVCFFCWTKWSKKEKQFYNKEWPTCPCCREPQIPWHVQHRSQLYFLFLLFLAWVYYDQLRDNLLEIQQKA